MPDASSRPEDLVIDRATPTEWSAVTEWAAGEGWNPGAGDAAAFFAQDSDGFFLGRIGGEPVSAISVVNYGSDYAFLGFYLVRADLRGHGLGLATWRAGLAHAGGRVVGLDGVPDQQDNYRRSGFELAYRSARFAGVPQLPPADRTVRPMAPDDAVAVYRYDSACLPADRPEFLAEWLSGAGRHTIVRVVDGELTGFAQVRPARDGLRVGPLFADEVDDARQLLSALGDFAPGTPLAIDVPLRNEPAVKLMAEAGLSPSFETARMYTGRVRIHHQDKVFGVTSLELG
ncbi:GNAT family N-acetyltransferase [Nocardia sp. 2]|uniref:GNAT family N-acetyltransferase n=1 Tax=Nocardia acididurans TaxID=2802282 RepID=A0ABS1MCG4_9NOCA|nr:GNAT family N-acetyltransferase [Nocardia acididurans]MBL1078350.1 GNAT family N-acetyltransferase [Nocardia acididurans]